MAPRMVWDHARGTARSAIWEMNERPRQTPCGLLPPKAAEVSNLIAG